MKHLDSWSPLRLATLLRYHPSAFVEDPRQARAEIRSLVADGLLIPLSGSPYYRLSPAGVEVCNRVLRVAALYKASPPAKPEAIYEKVAKTLSTLTPRPVAREDIAAGDLVTIHIATGEVWRAPFTKPEPDWLKDMSRAQRRHWEDRYARWKTTGAELHERKIVSRTQWRHLFDIIFARTDKLRNTGLHYALRSAIWRAKRGAKRDRDITFEKLRKIALETLTHDGRDEDDDA